MIKARLLIRKGSLRSKANRRRKISKIWIKKLLYLKKKLKLLISKKKKGESFRAVVLKNDMKLIGEDIMAHWYGIKGKDYIDYMNRYFDEKW
jgi:hypothetical protein